MIRPLLAINIAQRVRLQAERNAESAVQFPEAADGLSMTEFGDVQFDQRQLFRARRASLNSKIASIESEISQAESILDGLQQQADAQRARVGLTKEELVNAEILAKSGSGTRFRVLQIMRTMAELQSDLASLVARASETRGRIEHGRREIDRSRAAFSEQIEHELQQAERERFDLMEKFRQTESQIEGTDVRAPCSGSIVNLALHTIGGVVAPGMTILEVVPSEERLFVEVQVRPADIENVRTGLQVEIRLGGYSGKRLPRLDGIVTNVSADRLTDKLRGTPFFLVRVQVSDHANAALSSHMLRPGMTVDVMIFTGERTLVQYLATPLLSFLSGAMRE